MFACGIRLGMKCELEEPQDLGSIKKGKLIAGDRSGWCPVAGLAACLRGVQQLCWLQGRAKTENVR